MKAIDIWKGITARDTCSRYNCDTCRKLYDMNEGCPSDIHVPKEQYDSLIQRVTLILQNNTVTDVEVLGEEIADILVSYNDC